MVHLEDTQLSKAGGKMSRVALDSSMPRKQKVRLFCLFFFFFLVMSTPPPRSSTRDIPSHLTAQTWITYSFLYTSLGCGMEVPQMK